jgi:hypothetical protein
MPELALHQIGSLNFPGRAGTLQRAGAVPALVTELGDNYSSYHGFLQERLKALGGRPDPNSYEDQSAYFADWAKVTEIVQAEILLRSCHAYRTAGAPLGSESPQQPPLIDPNDQLVSLVTPHNNG